MKLREVTDEDHLFVSVLLRTAFGGPAEERLVERLRAEGDMALELVAEDDDTGEIVGHISFARMTAPEGWWALAPVSVTSTRQNQGIGSEIIRYGLDQCRQRHATAVVVVGAPRYYRRFGFSLKAAEQLESPYPKEFTMLYPIAPHVGTEPALLVYPAAFTEV